MDEYYELPDAPLLDFLNQFKGIVEINRLSDLRFIKAQLEAHHLFESAQDLQTWYDFLSECIQAEFDESCLNEPVPSLDGYYIPKQQECEELGDGWLHEWELGEDFYNAA